MERDDLLRYGIPAEWLDDVLAADEDSLLELADHLPAEAAEALLEIATGGKPAVVEPATPDTDPFAHPDAQRRFRMMSNVEELERALDFPWDKWTVFLHPAQRQWVERDYNGPARVSGSAGTGKTIVALHRAVWLAREHPHARVLLTTFSDTLANALRDKLARLISNQPMIGERLEVQAIDRLATRLHQVQRDSASLASQQDIDELLVQAAAQQDPQPFTQRFLQAEWREVVDAWQLQTWEGYRDVRRLGRKTRLPEQQRALLWSIFERVRAALAEHGQITEPGIFSQLAVDLAGRSRPLFDFAVVDEAQDIGVAQLRFLAALGGGRPNSLFFAGDLGQRIFQTPFSWRALGVDIRGRSRTLHINYRTSHQIRRHADRLLGPEVSDIDGNTEDRSGTVSAFNGPAPTIEAADSIEDERDAVANWLRRCTEQGVVAEEVGVFVRSSAELDRARSAVESADLGFVVLDDKVRTSGGKVSISTMHLAKGLEFRAVAVMACDDEVIPSQTRIDAVADEADLQEVYNTERHLLYVASTRARDHLLVIGVAPAPEFLDDLEP